VGGGAFETSTLLTRLNEGDYDAIPGQLSRWIYADGQILEGLKRRRYAEGALFSQGDHGSGSGGSMTVREIQEHLRHIGWPLKVDGEHGARTQEAVSDFQRGFAFWKLQVDGDPGPKTQEAMRKSVQAGGRASPNFSFREFRSKGDGWIKVHRALVLGLEDYRGLVGGPVNIVSGYRDPAYNDTIPGSAKNSQHVYGNSADIEPVKSWQEVKRLGRFSGIGYQSSTQRVRHVDVRHVGPNTTGNTVRNPALWPYGQRGFLDDEYAEPLLHNA
jgi:peptidoglycan hydrolase-like protein with peptidoglycan-binding domain